MNIIQKPSPNFTAGRNGKQIIAIVCHITAGSFPGCLNWMQNPVAKASAHYLVNKKGEIYQLVQDKDTSWHVGIVNKCTWNLYDGTNPNRYTLGIEFESLGEGLTEPQYKAGLWLIDMLVKKYNIPIDDSHIIGHYKIDGVNRVNDPGKNFPWIQLFKDLREGMEVADWMKKIIDDALTVGLITERHNPTEPVQKWFVLAIALNLLKIVKR